MAGFHLYTSNRLERLSEKLIGILGAAPLPPMQPEIIVVQSKGMEHWLRLEIAGRMAMCANTVFPFPRLFVYQIFRELIDQPDISPYSPDIVAWKVMKVLPEVLDNPAFSSLKRYLAGEHTGLKRFQLAEKIAAVFDQYLIFRPDVINGWDRTAAVDDFPHAAWQALLWQTLSHNEQAALHPAALKKAFLDAAQNGFQPADLPSRISVFGISTLPPYYLEVFSALARSRDIHFLYLSPCREYWEYAYSEKDIARFAKTGLTDEDQYFDTGNSLLASMGASGREFFSLMLNTVGETGTDMYEDPGDETMLSRIQSDILNLHDREESAGQGGADGSLQIHSCHSPVREVEVLYDALLDLFDRTAYLLPKDIVVMAPDITRYAPFIQAIFEAPEEESLRIPYAIADTSIRTDSRLADAFLSLLSIDRERFRAPAVLDILECAAVRARFQLTEADLDTVRSWVRSAGIRWGMDGVYRAGLGLPPLHENTWRFGLDRMLLGYALSETADLQLVSGLVPCGDIGGDAARVLGCFARFMETLFACARLLNRDRTLLEWGRELCRLLELFFEPDDASADDLQVIRTVFTEQGLAGLSDASGFEEPVPLEIIRTFCARRFDECTRSHGFISRGVTFCTMLPMRSIPFKVVCLLGMNDGEYPRRSRQPGFDLMKYRRRLCDRSRRHEDRYVFLEALLSARQHFIVSYVGRGIKDNADILPSVLVCELLDYIRQAFGEDACRGVHMRHPLQPFSRHYFSGCEPRLFSYSRQNCVAAQQALQPRTSHAPFIPEPLPAPAERTWKEVTAEQLCRFFANPARFLICSRLAMDLEADRAEEVEDREPFELNALQRYALRQELAGACLAGQDARARFDGIRARGDLPPGSSGVFAYQKLLQESAAFAVEVSEHIDGGPGEPHECVFSLAAPPLSIRGRLAAMYGAQQVFYRCAKLKAKDMLRAWIYHLLLQAEESSAGDRITRLIGQNGHMVYAALAQEQARTVLADLAELFVRGLREPLCFFPETSCAFASALENNKNETDALAAAKGAWATHEHSPGESEDVHFAACFGTDLPAGADFKETALRVFAPLLAATRTL